MKRKKVTRRARPLSERQLRSLLLQTLKSSGDVETIKAITPKRGKKVAAAKPSRTKRAPIVPPKRTTPKKKQDGVSRLYHERSKRSAATRKVVHTRVTSRSRRTTVAKIQYEQAGFILSDVLRGLRSGNGLPGTPAQFEGDLLRANVDAVSAPMVGRTVQVTYYVSVDNEDGSGTKVVKRVRRVYRNFRGREDIANGVNPSVRYSYDAISKHDGTLQGAYIRSFSLAVVDDSQGSLPLTPPARKKSVRNKK